MLALEVQDGFFLQATEPVISYKSFDEVEAELFRGEPVEAPVEHFHFPGLYVRQITMYAGSLITSKIHRTEHPFVILKGDVSVFTEEEGEVRLRAPHFGRTTPGTRRLLYCHEDTVWQTFHCNPDGETVEEIEARIIEPHFNPVVGMTHAEMSKLVGHENFVLHNE